MARSTRLVIHFIHFMGSETLPSASYILSDESSIPFYSTSNGYNNYLIVVLYTKNHYTVTIYRNLKIFSISVFDIKE